MQQEFINGTQQSNSITGLFQENFRASQLDQESYNTIKQLCKEYIQDNVLLSQIIQSENVFKDAEQVIINFQQWENQNDTAVDTQQYNGDLEQTKQELNQYQQQLQKDQKQLQQLQQYWGKYDFSQTTNRCIQNLQSIIKDCVSLLEQEIVYDDTTQQSSLNTLQTFTKIAQTIRLINGIRYAETDNTQIRQQIINEISRLSSFTKESIEEIKEYLLIVLKPIKNRQQIENYNLQEIKNKVNKIALIVDQTIQNNLQIAIKVENAEIKAYEIIQKGLKLKKMEKCLKRAEQQSEYLLQTSQAQDEEYEFTQQKVEEEISSMKDKINKQKQDFQKSCAILTDGTLTKYQAYDILTATEIPEAYIVFQQIDNMITYE